MCACLSGVLLSDQGCCVFSLLNHSVVPFHDMLSLAFLCNSESTVFRQEFVHSCVVIS